jgi:hypothetical protein
VRHKSVSTRSMLSRAVRVGRRAYSTGLPPLPATAQEWKKAFPSNTLALRDRISIRNPETAAQLANAFVPDGQKDKVIVEAFPGE